MMIVCGVQEEQCNLVKVVLVDDGLHEIYLQQCEQNHFCEQLPAMMKNVIEKLEQFDGKDVHDIEWRAEFDLNRHITTYRIFESFMNGIFR